MQKANKLVCATIFMLYMNIHAETPPATTLNQAIDVIKARKASELNVNSQAYSNAPKVDSKKESNKDKPTDNSIKLWSINGVGNNLRAEIIYQGKIKEVSISSKNMQVGNWVLVGISEKEAIFSAFAKNGKLSRMRLRLKLPQPSEYASIWPAPIMSDMNLTGGPMRPPVPMSMLNP